ncbi:MAG: isocitrate lyase, partial [Pseudomonadales bacterium]
MSNYLNEIEAVRETLKGKAEWGAINPEYVVRMRQQNRFHTGLDIAKYTAAMMRRDMAAYDADTSKYTQSLGAWHGFIAQQTMMAVK